MEHDTGTLDPDDLARLIDASFDDGPRPAADVQDLLSSGRRAVRRRRAAVVMSTVAAVAVLGVSTAVLAGGDPRAASDVPAAPQPTSAVPPTTDLTTGPAEVASAPVTTSPPAEALVDLGPDNLATYGADGRLYVFEDAVVRRWVHNPFDIEAPGTSDALAVSYRGSTTWIALDRSPGGGGGASQPADSLSMSFAQWVQAMAPLDGDAADPPPDPQGEWPGHPMADLVRFGDGERLEALPGVEILTQRPHPRVGDSFAGPDDRSAVAEVESAEGRFYVLARVPADGPAQYIGVSADEGGATLDVFLELARARYAEGGGGLL